MALVKAMWPRQLAAGEQLFFEGDPSHTWYVVFEGTAIVSHKHAQLATIGCGQLIGEFGVVHGSPRTATVVASTAMAVWGLEGSRHHAIVADAAHRGVAPSALAPVAEPAEPSQAEVYSRLERAWSGGTPHLVARESLRSNLLFKTNHARMRGVLIEKHAVHRQARVLVQ